LAGAYVDEASLVDEAFWKQLTYRLSEPGARLFATTNPDSTAQWLKRSWIDRAPELSLATWHFTLADNPGLTADYIAQLEAERRPVAQTVHRRPLGCRRRRHLRHARPRPERPPPHHWDQLPILTGAYWLGVDYGTQNPFHAVLIGTGIDDRLYVVGEWRYDGRTAHKQLDPAQYETRLRGWLDGGAGITIAGKQAVEVWPYRTAVDP